jgi:aspartate-semialdehyde dehydrogenase
MKKYRAGIVGATGMVGQRFAVLLDNHPFFEVTAIAASPRSAGKTYTEALDGRWKLDVAMPEYIKNMTVLDANDIDAIKPLVDFVFCAIDLPKAEVRKLEEKYAKAEIIVVSNNSACRGLPDVPMLIPEINPEHTAVIETQKKRLGTKRGFIAVKPNCSIQSYVPMITPLLQYEPYEMVVTTYQAISGAGKTFAQWPEKVDNVIPYIGGEEEKSEKEPLKIWGKVENGEIKLADSPKFTAQCIRVPVSDGHMGAVFMRFKDGKKPTKEEILDTWANCAGRAQELNLPSAPKQFLHYFTEDNLPQTKLQRELEGGMAISIGRLREDTQYDYKFVCLSHNTLRGAAGGGVLLAELLCAEGLID